MKEAVVPGYKVSLADGYVLEEYWGKIDPRFVADASRQIQTLFEQHKTRKVLIDLRQVDYSTVEFPVQVEGMKQVWLLKRFEKMALLSAQDGMTELINKTIGAFHFDHYKVFDDERAAVRWLKA